MIARIKEFLDQLLEPEQAKRKADDSRALQIATAALLLEIAHKDEHLNDVERQAMAAALRRQFSLDADELEQLIALGQRKSREAIDFFQFTSLINKSCTAEQKIVIIENLWLVAMADSHLDALETHLIRKIADLLYVSHADYISAKLWAREATKPSYDGASNGESDGRRDADDISCRHP